MADFIHMVDPRMPGQIERGADLLQSALQGAETAADQPVKMHSEAAGQRQRCDNDGRQQPERQLIRGGIFLAHGVGMLDGVVDMRVQAVVERHRRVMHQTLVMQ